MMNEDRGSGIEVAPAIGISYSVAIGEGRSIVLQTHVPQTWSTDESHALIDKLRELSDRQVQFGKIENMEHEVELKGRLIKQLEEGIAAVDAKVEALQRNGSITGAGKGPHQTSKAAMEQEAQQRKNAVQSLMQEQKTKAELENRIADMRKTLG